MSYRMFIKPLTEQTGAKPEKHELMVNTNSGMISVINSDGENVSALKDISFELPIKKEILDFLESANEEIVNEINKLDPLFKNENNRIKDISYKLELLKSLNKDITSRVDNIKNNNIDTYIMIQQVINKIYQITDVYSKCFLDISKVERKVGNLLYLSNILKKNKVQAEKDIKKLKSRVSTVNKLLDTKEDESTYNAWVNDYVNRTKALSKDKKVDSISFKKI